MILLARLRFSLRFRTLSRVVSDPDDGQKLIVFYRGKTVRIPSRCPHQGAPLRSGYFDGNCFVCGWHGCRFNLKTAAAHTPAELVPASLPKTKTAANRVSPTDK